MKIKREICRILDNLKKINTIEKEKLTEENYKFLIRTGGTLTMDEPIFLAEILLEHLEKKITLSYDDMMHIKFKIKQNTDKGHGPIELYLLFEDNEMEIFATTCGPTTR